ncbi:MAG: hypothetical protein CLLPBCKN_004890 [Chroococcidiopsis cubana SAG 39.79]|nr:hypothetical protein [Chroococcidiopsis cubana SAG 39.79]
MAKADAALSKTLTTPPWCMSKRYKVLTGNRNPLVPDGVEESSVTRHGCPSKLINTPVAVDGSVEAGAEVG